MYEFKQYTKRLLEDTYTQGEIYSITMDIISHLLRCDKTKLLFPKEVQLSDNTRILAMSMVEKIRQKVPIQYVLQRAYFYNEEFEVVPNVLIPRPETEELVEWIIRDNNQKKHQRILDIGTGSGCIAISLKKYLNTSIVTGWDISPIALDIARKNSKKIGVKIEFDVHDILSSLPCAENWDIIVSNPPYIPISSQQQMDCNVVRYEPALALFVPDESPLVFYEKIANFAQSHLSEGGLLYFEIHQDYGDEIVELLENKGFGEITLKKDLSKNDRMVKAQRQIS